MFAKLRNPLLAALLCLSSFSVFAGDITQVKGTKALINLGGEPASPGSEFFGIDGAGKKKAILRVTQVKNDRAIAEIIKGVAQVGMGIQSKAPSAGSSQNATTSSAPTSAPVTSPAPSVADPSAPEASAHSSRPKGFLGKFLGHGSALGIDLGVAQDTMTLTAKRVVNSATYSQDVTMNGNSFNLMGFYDFDATPWFSIELRAGIENFTTTGSVSQLNAPVCTDSTSCTVNFMYLAGEGMAKFNFIHSRSRYWVGAGGAFLLVASKSSSVANLDTTNATNQMILLGAGGDIALGKGATFIPFMLEYGLFPGSSSVKATAINLRAGYGWRY